MKGNIRKVYEYNFDKDNNLICKMNYYNTLYNINIYKNNQATTILAQLDSTKIKRVIVTKSTVRILYKNDTTVVLHHFQKIYNDYNLEKCFPKSLKKIKKAIVKYQSGIEKTEKNKKGNIFKLGWSKAVACGLVVTSLFGGVATATVGAASISKNNEDNSKSIEYALEDEENKVDVSSNLAELSSANKASSLAIMKVADETDETEEIEETYDIQSSDTNLIDEVEEEKEKKIEEVITEDEVLVEENSEITPRLMEMDNEKEEFSFLSSLESRIIIPASVDQTGITKNNTNYIIYYPRWDKTSNQRVIADQWDALGRTSNNGIATLNDRYLVAVSPKFGVAGDYIDVILEDGTVINCIIGDVKGADATSEWGHELGDYGVDLLEWEIVDSKENVTIDEWEGKKVYCIINITRNQNMENENSEEVTFKLTI